MVVGRTMVSDVKVL